MVEQLMLACNDDRNGQFEGILKGVQLRDEEILSLETCLVDDEDVCEFVEWMNLHYRALEHTISFKNAKGTKEPLQLWKEQKTKIVYYE